MTTPDYNLEKIRALLTDGFTDDELRRLCYDVPNFRPIYDELAQGTGKAKIIDRLIEYANQKLQFESLLVWTKEHNPARYEEHQPYYSIVLNEIEHISQPGITTSEGAEPVIIGKIAKSSTPWFWISIGMFTLIVIGGMIAFSIAIAGTIGEQAKAPVKGAQPTEESVITDLPVLEVGQTWKQGGVELTLVEVSIPASGDHVFTDWMVTNNSNQDILITYSVTNFSANDNLGRPLEISGIGAQYSIPAKQIGGVFKPGLSKRNWLAIQFDVGYSSAREIIVTASNISRIEKAQWKIEVSSY